MIIIHFGGEKKEEKKAGTDFLSSLSLTANTVCIGLLTTVIKGYVKFKDSA